MKALIFGTGQSAEKILNCLKPSVEVRAFLDNDSSKWGEVWKGVRIIPPEKHMEESFDFIILALKDYKIIEQQLIKRGVNPEKLIMPLSYEHKKYENWRNIFYVEELIYLELNERMETLKIQINNLEYELAAKIKAEKIRYPKILSWEKAVDEVVRNKKSMSRFGDGEFDIMLGRYNCFQDSDAGLVKRLQEVLKSNLSNHIVAIPNIYGYFENRTASFVDYFRTHLANGVRQREYALFDMEKEYYDSFITRTYKDFVDRSKTAYKYDLLKTMWADRDITIVEGELSRLGVGNDLFKGASSCIRILGPSKNAFYKYDEILKAVTKTQKNRLVLIALGATATVLAYDLARLGYQALDIGHIDIEYEWYLQSAQEVTPIEGKYVSEVPGGDQVSTYVKDDRYYAEVVETIC